MVSSRSGSPPWHLSAPWGNAIRNADGLRLGFSQVRAEPLTSYATRGRSLCLSKPVSSPRNSPLSRGVTELAGASAQRLGSADTQSMGIPSVPGYQCKRHLLEAVFPDCPAPMTSGSPLTCAASLLEIQVRPLVPLQRLVPGMRPCNSGCSRDFEIDDNDGDNDNREKMPCETSQVS